MKANPDKIVKHIFDLGDELVDVLCDPNAKRFGTLLNFKARGLARQIHAESTKLRLLFDPD